MSLAAALAAARARSGVQGAQWNPAANGGTGTGIHFSPIQQFAKPPPPPRRVVGGSLQDVMEQARSNLKSHNQQRAQQELAQRFSGPIGGVINFGMDRLNELQRIGVLGVEEMAKKLPEPLEHMQALTWLVDEEKAVEDERSNVEKLRDPRYGFGEISYDTGNKWADRAIGFAGDTVLDPLTYVAPGSGKYAGAGGRYEAATRILKAGESGFLPKELAEQQARQVGRLGVSGADDWIRDAVLQDKAGVRFMGARIPGSERVTQPVGRRVGATRAAIGDLGGGRLGATRYTQGLEESMAIMNGRKPGDITAAAVDILDHNTRRMLEGGETWNFRKAVKQIRKAKPQRRVQMTHDIEAGRIPNELGEKLFARMAAEGVSGAQQRANYVQHLATRKGAKWFGRGGAGKVTIDTAESTGRAFERAIVPGTTLDVTHTLNRFGDLVPLEGGPRRVTFKDATIKEINDKLEPILGFKVYEDDYGILAEAMVRTTASDIATVGSLGRMMDQFPSQIGRVGDESKRRLNNDLFSDLIDPVRQARDRAKAQRAELAGDEIDLWARGARNEFRDTAEGMLPGLEDEAAQLAEQLGVKGRGRMTGPKRWRGEDRLAELEEKIATLKDALARTTNRELGLGKHSTVRGQREAVSELEAVVRQFDGTPEMAMTIDLLDEVVDMQRRVDNLNFTIKDMRDMIEAGKRGELGDVFDIAPGYQKIETELLADGGDIVMSDALAGMRQRAMDAMRDREVWQLIDDYTKLFKTYATMTPGFHVRNAMSAMWMNFVGADDVATMYQDTREAFSIFRLMRKHPEEFMDAIRRRDVDAIKRLGGKSGRRAARAEGEVGSWDDFFEAIEAALGSGMGSVGRAEMGTGATTRGGSSYNWLLDNALTRFNRETVGEWVEGPVRIAMALNVVKAGGSGQDALRKISRFQFDYSQLSTFDQRMKQFVPFWTFTSRSVPLQLQEAWLQPGKYSAVDRILDRSSSNEDFEGMPDWMKSAGGIAIGDGVGFLPDLPHLDLGEMFTENPTKLLSNLNPIGRVPAEIMLDHQSFQNRPFYDDESKLKYALLNLMPSVGQVERVGVPGVIDPGAVSGYLEGEESQQRRMDKALQSRLNYLGIPIKFWD